MMHALVDRHRGHLPIVTVEHVWREIISTFTWLQAPYTVHVATGDAAETRDMARFYFASTVPFETAGVPADAIAPSRAPPPISPSSVSARPRPRGGRRCPWRARRPRVIGPLPFIAVEDRPWRPPPSWSRPPLKDPTAAEVAVFACRGPADPSAHAWLKKRASR